MCVCECVSRAKWRCEQTTDGKGFSITEMWLLSLLMNGENLQINSKCTVKTNVWKCDSAHRKSPENAEIGVAGSQHKDYETLPVGIFRM